LGSAGADGRAKELLAESAGADSLSSPSQPTFPRNGGRGRRGASVVVESALARSVAAGSFSDPATPAVSLDPGLLEADDGATVGSTGASKVCCAVS
jgi:hypothetical protein